MEPYSATSFEGAFHEHQASVAVLPLTYVWVYFLMFALYLRVPHRAALMEIPPYFVAYCNPHLRHVTVNFGLVTVHNLQEVQTMHQQLLVEARTRQSSSFVTQILYGVFNALNDH